MTDSELKTNLSESGLLYYATNLLALPTIFNTEDEAKEAINRSKKEWPDAKFRIINNEGETQT